MATSAGKRTIVFIDGNNLYKTLIRFGIRLTPNEHLKLIDFIRTGFKIKHNLDLDIEHVFYYNSVPSIEDGEEMYNKHMKFIQEINSLPKWQAKTRKLQRSSNQEIIEERNSIIERLRLCEGCKPIAIQNCLECLGSSKKREKGIDVKIAIDMVKDAFKDKFDCCVLISGDADFIPALELVREIGKTPLSSFVSSRSYATDLREQFKSLPMRIEDIENLKIR